MVGDRLSATKNRAKIALESIKEQDATLTEEGTNASSNQSSTTDVSGAARGHPEPIDHDVALVAYLTKGNGYLGNAQKASLDWSESEDCGRPKQRCSCDSMWV